MLTATADHHAAVQLFNEGLIDYFILKDSLDMHVELNNAIQNAQFNYSNYQLDEQKMFSHKEHLKENQLA